ncbi:MULTISPECIES: enoyl-CoA hydratase/isomerase family protein [unclassified Bradyrhizobium]|uniref:enoyl-CoA hydratase/isomerase family protein n=1 Tax=unclassified Bradyrhizobium TaxID=2631580 RepID=UPI000A0638C9|nr:MULTISPECIES: enoyl-CoA hydratase/isomerase family protein [unclassified Bradyrhizobium]QIG91324.1 enoyl-CoA hydratase/isomerase family protein [Bradyrhizobium sp. 6(2017)]
MTVIASMIDDTLLVTIDRPPVNALDLDAITSLEQSFAAAAADAPPNGVVLTGGGQAFSAGVDTRAFASYAREQRHAMVRAITRMLARLLAIPVPVVAAINGHALGGGFVLMLGCDYRLAVDSTAVKLGMTEAQAGIPFPSGPLEVMRHELSPELLRRLTLTSAVLSPRECLDQRIFDALCAGADLQSKSIAAAKSLAAQPGFRAVKRQIRGGLAERLEGLALTGHDASLALFG